MTAPVSRTMMPLRALVAARPSGTNRGLLHPLSNVKWELTAYQRRLDFASSIKVGAGVATPAILPGTPARAAGGTDLTT